VHLDEYARIVADLTAQGITNAEDSSQAVALEEKLKKQLDQFNAISTDLEQARATVVAGVNSSGKRTCHWWSTMYGFQPVLLETFVEYERHKGTCYKAANWINVERTAGRGKKSTSHKSLIPAKYIWLYPLHKSYTTLLCK